MVMKNKPRIDEDMDDEDMEEIMLGSGLRLFNKPVRVNQVDVYLDEDIKQLSYYRGLLHYIRNMNEYDSLTIWLDTHGGHLDSALAISDAIQNCEGNVTVIVTGNAFSAGSFIALSSPSLVVGDMSRFMLHQGSYVTGGKQGDIESHVIYSKKLLEKSMRLAYTGFLTEEEIQLMLIGKEFYFDSEEVQERLEKRKKIQEDEAAKEKEVVAEKPKRKPKVAAK